MDWSPDGRLLAMSADKGKQICIYDVRAGLEPIQNLEAHQGMGREGRILFCGDRLLSSGFTNVSNLILSNLSLKCGIIVKIMKKYRIP